MGIRERTAQVIDLLAAIAVVGGIMMLVRPGSKGPELVDNVGGAFIAAFSGTIGFYPGKKSQPYKPTPGSSSSGGGSSDDGGGFGLGDLIPKGPITGIPLSPVSYPSQPSTGRTINV